MRPLIKNMIDQLGIDLATAKHAIEEAQASVEWLAIHAVKRDERMEDVDETLGGVMHPDLELRWLEQWVPDKETDGRHSIKERVLQWRTWAGHGWTTWHDVPVYVKVEV